MEQTRKLEGQIAIITGSSSGIGAGCARELAKNGATVVVNYPMEKAKPMADAVAAEIIAEGNNAIVYQCDVSKEEEVIKMFADVIKQFGTVDILINNAGLQSMLVDAPATCIRVRCCCNCSCQIQ